MSLEYIRRSEQKTQGIKSKGKIYSLLNSNEISKEKDKGKHASSTESRRIVWEFIVWPLILKINRQYFTIHEYRRKVNEFAKINNIPLGSPKLSGGLISLINRGIIIKNNGLYSIHYRLIPYMRKKVKLEYGLAFREIYSKH